MNAERRVIKRIKGLPHDIIETRKPDLIIKGKNENWHKIIRVPNNHIWISGDRNGSTYDSSMFGPVSFNNLRSFITY
jgi:signal peptidase I